LPVLPPSFAALVWRVCLVPCLERDSIVFSHWDLFVVAPSSPRIFPQSSALAGNSRFLFFEAPFANPLTRFTRIHPEFGFLYLISRDTVFPLSILDLNFCSSIPGVLWDRAFCEGFVIFPPPHGPNTSFNLRPLSASFILGFGRENRFFLNRKRLI